MNPSDPDFQCRFTARIVELQGHMLRMEIDVPRAVMLVAQLQLALRHPDNKGESARTMREFTKGLIALIAGRDELLKTGLEAGFDPAHDEPRPAV